MFSCILMSKLSLISCEVWTPIQFVWESGRRDIGLTWWMVMACVCLLRSRRDVHSCDLIQCERPSASQQMVWCDCTGFNLCWLAVSTPGCCDASYFNPTNCPFDHEGRLHGTAWIEWSCRVCTVAFPFRHGYHYLCFFHCSTFMHVNSAGW